MVQNANTQLALKLVRESGQLQLGVYAIAPLNHIVVELSADHQPLYETQLTLKPGESWQQTLPENGVGRLTLKVKPPRTSRCWIIRNILPNRRRCPNQL